MSSIVHCYLRPLRREWGLTQADLASLLPKGGRNRVSRIERGLAPPNAQEIVAYALIFGSPSEIIFRGFHAETCDLVLREARRLHRRLGRDPSILAASKRELLERLFTIATKPDKAQAV